MSDFIRFYLRGWFWLAVVGVPVLLWIEGDAGLGGILLGAALGAAASLISAVVFYRRGRQAERYVSPQASLAPREAVLPSSVVTAPESLDRRRGMGIVWWSLVVGSAVALIAGFWAAIEGHLGDSGAAEVWTAVLAGLSILWLLVAIMFVWSWPALLRNARLVSEHPGALVIVGFFGFDGVSAGLTMREISGEMLPWWRARLRMLTTLVVDDGGIGFWSGGGRPRRQYQVAWSEVSEVASRFVEVDSGGGSSTNLGIDIGLRLREDGRRVGTMWLSFLVGRSDTWISFPHRSRAIVESVAAAIEARRPGSIDHFRGETIEEVREALAELAEEGEHELIETVMDELEEWLARRGGVPPRGGEWLPERLAERRR